MNVFDAEHYARQGKPTPDGWTLAPSGWEYKWVPTIGVMQKRPEPHNVRELWRDDENVPPIDRELVRSLWEAKDG